MKFAFFNNLATKMHNTALIAHEATMRARAEFSYAYDAAYERGMMEAQSAYNATDELTGDYAAGHYCESDYVNGALDNDSFIDVISSGNTYLECIYDSSLPFTQESWRALVDLADQLQDDPIMDVLRGWEMEDGMWLQESPLVLRFELQDVVLQPAEDGTLRIWHGILDDESDCLLEASWLPNGAHMASSQLSRLHRERCRMGASISQACWLPYAPLFKLIGASTTTRDWLSLAQRINSTSNPTVADCVKTLIARAA